MCNSCSGVHGVFYKVTYWIKGRQFTEGGFAGREPAMRYAKLVSGRAGVISVVVEHTAEIIPNRNSILA